MLRYSSAVCAHAWSLLGALRLSTPVFMLLLLVYVAAHYRACRNNRHTWNSRQSVSIWVSTVIGRRLALTVPVCLHLLCRVSRHFGDRRGKERKSALVLEDVAMTLCVKGVLVQPVFRA